MSLRRDFPQLSRTPILLSAIFVRNYLWTSLIACLLITTACARAEPSVAAPVPSLARPTEKSTSQPFNNPTNPFGIIANLNSPQKMAMVKDLRVTYFRPSDAIIIDKWDGKCAQCDAARQIDMKLILTVRANGGGVQNPTTPPKDIVAYQKTLGDVLDKYPPQVLVVENEENSSIFYTGTPPEYAVELQAACDVAHRKSIPCTNGGLVSGEVALLVWENYFVQGKTQPACDFAQRSFDANEAQRICAFKSLDQIPAREKDLIAKGKALLDVYKTSSIDWMNFHWYIADPRALEESAAFLKAATNKPLMSNEMGQQDESPTTVTGLLVKSLDLQLPIVLWFSIDSAQSKALNNPDATLRPTGDAFRSFMQARFK